MHVRRLALQTLQQQQQQQHGGKKNPFKSKLHAYVRRIAFISNAVVMLQQPATSLRVGMKSACVCVCVRMGGSRVWRWRLQVKMRECEEVAAPKL